MATTLHHWTNGAIFEGAGGRFSDVTNPATGEVTGQLPLASEADVNEVVAAADFDGVISSCVFGWEEDARGVSERQRGKATDLVTKHFGTDAGAALTNRNLINA